ncbi:MAG: response regulator [Actinomycetota bacterium]
MRILVIDDDVDIVRLQDIKLKKAGHEVWTATDGISGTAAAKEHRPEVIILETELTGRHGHDLIRGFKKGRKKPPLVIIVSHQDSDEAIEAGLAAGADDYMTKPFSPRVLAERIRVTAARNA